MTLWLIVRRSLRQHLLSSIVTAVLIALAGGLVMSVWAVKRQAHATFTGQSGGWDAVDPHQALRARAGHAEGAAGPVVLG